MSNKIHTAYQLSVILFGNQTSELCWRGLRLDRQGALNLLKNLASSDYDMPVLENLQYIAPFLPDPELERIMNTERYLYKMHDALLKVQLGGTPCLIKLKGFADSSLKTELAKITKNLPDKSLYQIIAKDSCGQINPPIASFVPDDPKLFPLMRRMFEQQNDGTTLSRWMTAYFGYIESDSVFANSVDFLLKNGAIGWAKAAMLHYRNITQDKDLFIKAMVSWLTAELGYVHRPSTTLPVEFVSTLPGDLLIKMYSHLNLIGYLPSYPDLGKKCLGTILHNPAARNQVANAVRRATWVKQPSLDEYRKASLPHMPAENYPMSMYLIDLFLINNLQTCPHSEGQFINFLNCVEYQQVPESIKPHPEAIKNSLKTNTISWIGGR